MSGRAIAVIGGGISGLTAAYVLSRSDRVTLFEADTRLGGHADTHLVRSQGAEIPVDTGFIVYNERTYPLLSRLLSDLGVSTQESEMSMSINCVGCGVSYAGKRGPRGLAAGVPRGGGRYLRLLAEVPRFHRAARRVLASTELASLSFGEFLRAEGFSRYFVEHFAIPLVAAVWSCPAATALRYPAGYLFTFLANHGMLSISGSPQWRTVLGGAHSYVRRVAAQVAEVRLGTLVRSVRRYPDGTEVRDEFDVVSRFDAVVISTHADQALRLLDPPTPNEQQVLGMFEYTVNRAMLHTDSRMLPPVRAVRASWNYSLDCGAPGHAKISYYMNKLQGLPGSEDYIVTLGDADEIEPTRLIATMNYAHPTYTFKSIEAQMRLPSLNTSVISFAGAYHGWGFHEDGCRSGVAAARALGGTW